MVKPHTSLARLHWWRGFLAAVTCAALGAGIGCALALGWLFEQAGGWR